MSNTLKRSAIVETSATSPTGESSTKNASHSTKTIFHAYPQQAAISPGSNPIKRIKITMQQQQKPLDGTNPDSKAAYYYSNNNSTSIPSLVRDSETDSCRQSMDSFSSPQSMPIQKLHSVSGRDDSGLGESVSPDLSPQRPTKTEPIFLDVEAFNGPQSDDSGTLYSSSSNSGNSSNASTVNATTEDLLAQISINPSEEYDDHKDGTERMAREAIRRAITKNKKLTETYKLSLILGWGGNGVVLGAKKDKKPVAIKLIYKRESALTVTPEKDLPSEINILKQLDHPSILEFIEWFEDESAYFVVTERIVSNWSEYDFIDEEDYCPSKGGDDDDIKSFEECMTVRIPQKPFMVRMAIRSGASDLFSYIDLNVTIPTTERRDIFYDIAAGIAHMHAKGVTHGDVKEENVLLSNDIVAKLCDFGHSRKRHLSATPTSATSSSSSSSDKRSNNFPSHLFEKRVAFYGTKDMTPPELLPNLKKKYTKQPLDKYTGFEADVWALGLLLYAMCIGTLGSHHKDFLNSAQRNDLKSSGVYPGKYHLIKDQQCVDLVKKMLTFDPKKRLSMRQVLRHPWLRGV